MTTLLLILVTLGLFPERPAAHPTLPGPAIERSVGEVRLADRVAADVVACSAFRFCDAVEMLDGSESHVSSKQRATVRANQQRIRLGYDEINGFAELRFHIQRK